MTALTTRQLLEVPAQLIVEIASGVEDPEILAARHGFTPEQWLELKAHAPFQRAVKDKTSDLSANGTTFRLRSQVAAEQLLTSFAQKALHEDASFSQQLDALKLFTKAAGVDAPIENLERATSKFSITINLGAGQVIQVNAQTNAEKIIEVDDVVLEEELDLPSAVPVYLQVNDLLTVTE